MKQRKKCLENSNERADQIASRNKDKILGILKANLEQKHNVQNMFTLQGYSLGAHPRPTFPPFLHVNNMQDFTW